MKEIRSIIERYDSADHSSEKLALATVVNVEESSYRRIGARMLVSSNGEWVGGISGGCLEGDALKRSQKAIFDNKPSRVTYDTMDDDERQIGVGLGCNGVIEVLFLPIDHLDTLNPIEKLRSIVSSRSPLVNLQVIDGNNLKENLGHNVIFSEDEYSSYLSLSEKEVLQMTSQVFKSQKNQIFLTDIESHGKCKILCEFIKPEYQLVIIGDNYDVNAFSSISHILGWKTILVGRKKKMTKHMFNLADHVIEYEQISDLSLDPFTAVVLMTHDYNWDLKLLPTVLNSSADYVGLLGPRKRLVKMNQDIIDIDLSEKSKLFSPVGLDIGAETPEEIALSIAAEIIASFKNRDGRMLRDREGSIHERT